MSEVSRTGTHTTTPALSSTAPDASVIDGKALLGVATSLTALMAGAQGAAITSATVPDLWQGTPYEAAAALTEPMHLVFESTVADALALSGELDGLVEDTLAQQSMLVRHVHDAWVVGTQKLAQAAALMTGADLPELTQVSAAAVRSVTFACAVAAASVHVALSATAQKRGTWRELTRVNSICQLEASVWPGAAEADGAISGQAYAVAFVRPDYAHVLSSIEAPDARVFSLNQEIPEVAGLAELAASAEDQGYAAGVLWALDAAGVAAAAAAAPHQYQLSAAATPVSTSFTVQRILGSGPVNAGDVVMVELGFEPHAALPAMSSIALDEVEPWVSVGGVPAPEAAIHNQSQAAPNLAPHATPSASRFMLAHVVTQSEAATGALMLEAGCDATYEARATQANTTLTSSAFATTRNLRATVELSQPYGVTYAQVIDVTGAPQDAQLPTIKDVTDAAAPYAEGALATVLAAPTQPVQVREGNWHFTGWHAEDQLLAVCSQLPVAKSGLRLAGTWRFAPAAQRTLTYVFDGDAPVSAPNPRSGYTGDLIYLDNFHAQPGQHRGKFGTWRFTGWHLKDSSETLRAVALADADLTVYGTWEFVVPARSAESIRVANYRGTYDGQPHTFSINGLVTAGKAPDTVSYAVLAEGQSLDSLNPEALTWSSNVPTFEQAGTWQVAVRVESAAYAPDLIKTAMVSIGPRPVCIAANSLTAQAGTASLTPEITPELALPGEPQGLLNKYHVPCWAEIPELPQEPGTYPGAIKVAYVDNPNYDITTQPATLTLT